MLEQELIEAAWSALVSGSAVVPTLTQPTIDGDGTLSSAFPAAETAVACIASAMLASAALLECRNGSAPHLALDRDHVAAAVRSERYFEVDGMITGMGFAPLSRFWRAKDGWLRTHANYPWHRDALLRALDVSSADADAVATAIEERAATDIEDAVFAAGGIAAAVRTPDAWRRHVQGAAVADEPLIAHERIGDAPPRARTAPSPHLPAAGMRVLDFTRVIAGPVCTRYLGALGADVLRIDPPHRRDLADGEPGDTLLAKRSALLDLSDPARRANVDDLLETADVVVCGYRPGALGSLGFSPEQLVGRQPGLVIVVIDAWGHTGPWSQRRGFDSVVQAATGIGAIESSDGDEPGVLPCQLLDHGTGYLAAAAALDGLRRQTEERGTHVRRLSLARTAAWLTSAPRAATGSTGRAADDRADRFMQDMHDGRSDIRAVLPPGSVDGRQLQWPAPFTRYGADTAAWKLNRSSAGRRQQPAEREPA